MLFEQRVGFQRRGRGGAIVPVGNAISRRCVGVRIVAVLAHFGAIKKTIAVTVGIERIDETITIRIESQIGLRTIDDTIVIAVRISYDRNHGRYVKTH